MMSAKREKRISAPIFPIEALPKPLSVFVEHVSERQQCPPEYVAVPALCALSAVVGTNIEALPFENTKVTVPNLWGAVVGGPAANKKSACTAALAPLLELEKSKSREYEELNNRISSVLKTQAKKRVDKAIRLIQEGKLKKSLKQLNDVSDDLSVIIKCGSYSPTRRRLIVNDATIEKLGELLNENPNGLLLVRDDLGGWLSKLSGKEGQRDRGFYLECYDGDGQYMFDRVGHGTVKIKSPTLSVIGSFDAKTLAESSRVSEFDYEILSSFQLAVWPEIPSRFKWCDVPTDKDISKTYADCFYRLAAIPRDEGRAQFDNEAHEILTEWMEELQAEAKRGDLHPLMTAYLAKMPKTVAVLSLIFELIESGETVISHKSLAMALKLSDYLRSHSEKIYSLLQSS